MKKMISKMKKGVASFYIVAFSTLIMVIVAASFATVVISEVTRTSNEDLSQSAYDSALAGVEDAKLAYANYRRCLADGAVLPDGYTPDYSSSVVTCNDIIYWMEKDQNCDMVGRITGRLGKGESGEVAISDTVSIDGSTSVESDLNQAYTCVKINTRLSDYRASLTSSNQLRVIKAEFESPASAAKVKQVKLSWYAVREDVKLEYSNLISNGGSYRVAFQPTTSVRVATPPTLELQLIQTASSFTLSDFDLADGTRTDRATVYLVPASSWTAATGSKSKNYQGVGNTLSAEQVASTNNREVSNVPYAVYCNPDSTEDFYCSVTINLPEPINGERNNDTFMLVVSLPYGQPDTDFALEFWCNGGEKCNDVATTGTTGAAQAYISSSQVAIDSTGRANDLYRRVEVRLESANTSFAYPEYAIQLMSNSASSDTALTKTLTVTSECNYYDNTPGAFNSQSGSCNQGGF